MSNRNQFDAGQAKFLAPNLASILQPPPAENDVGSELKTNKSDIPKNGEDKPHILFFVFRVRPSMSLSLYVNKNNSFIFVPSWVLKCNATASRALSRRHIFDFETDSVSVFGSGHWGCVR